MNNTRGVLARKLGAAQIVLEHRYFGFLSPVDNLTTGNLKYLTLRNSILDVTHFARTADLPFDPSRASKAHHAPWVFSGCSYAGALAAWTQTVDPGIIWAYHASSAPV